MISKDISFKELNYEFLLDKSLINKELTSELRIAFKKANNEIYELIENFAFDGPQEEQDLPDTLDIAYDYHQTMLSTSIKVYTIVLDLVGHRNRSVVTKAELIEEKKLFDKHIRPTIHKNSNKIAEILLKNQLGEKVKGKNETNIED